MADTWQLIKSGNFEAACAEADPEARRLRSLGPLRNKVIALLHLQRFAEAEDLGRQILKKSSREVDVDFIFIGVSLWLQGKAQDALTMWSDGLDTTYTDAAGGVQVPMLLLYGGVRQGNESIQARAMSLLSERRSSINWPAPVADFAMGAISEISLRSKVSSQPVLQLRQTCQADFYVGVRHLRDGDVVAASASMCSACDQGLSASIEAEYHLAKWECRGKRKRVHPIK